MNPHMKCMYMQAIFTHTTLCLMCTRWFMQQFVPMHPMRVLARFVHVELRSHTLAETRIERSLREILSERGENSYSFQRLH